MSPLLLFKYLLSVSMATILTKFPSLQPAATKPLLGLYFAASWCPDCSGTTPLVGELAAANTDSLAVVYVASDHTPEQMSSYVPKSLAFVPFEKEQERADLKRHFGACGFKELAALGMTGADRKHGLPTLIILDPATDNIITTDGVNALSGSEKDSAVSGWLKQL